SRAELVRLVATLRSFDLARHDTGLTGWVDANTALTNAFWDSCRTRELARLEQIDDRRRAYRQQSLFTRRTESDAEAERQARAAAAAQFRLTTALHRRTIALAASPVLILLP